MAEDLDDLLKYYGHHEFPASYEGELYKKIENIMIDSKVPEYFIDWDTRNSKIIGRKGLFCISFQFKNRKLITMNFYVGKEY